MATYNGDNNDNIYSGTNDLDYIQGKGGNDTLNGLGGSDLIYGGGGNDSLNGGLGNDSLFGGTGADTYLLAKNDGNDFINNYDNDYSTDVVKFTDVASTDITAVSRVYDDLLLSYGGDTQLTVSYYFRSASDHIDQFQFSDGVIWSRADIKPKVLKPTDGNDVLSGLDNKHNNLSGLAGNDMLLGGNLSPVGRVSVA